MMDFGNKRILIIGASSGIGRQIAYDLDSFGADLILVSRTRQKLDALNKTLSRNNHIVYECDVSSQSSLSQLCTMLKSSSMPLDGMVYSVGISKTKPLHMLSYDDYKSLFGVNFYPAMHLTSFFSKSGIHTDDSSIVLISSVASIRGRIGTSVYSATKGALAAFSRAAAVELSKKRIRINCISPGWTKSPLTDTMEKKLPLETLERMKGQYPLGIGTPEDTSNMACFLLSPQSKWITGQNIIIDGGATSWML